jgi:hypothetical protein
MHELRDITRLYAKGSSTEKNSDDEL